MSYFRVFFLLLLFLILSNAFAQLDYWVPAVPPGAEYTVDINISFEDRIAEGQGSIRFLNTGKNPMTVVAMDYQLSRDKLITVKQQNVSLEAYNPDNKEMINAPLFFILNDPVDEGQYVELEFAFKRRLMLDEHFESYDSQDLIPTLWWDDIRVSDSYKVKVRTDQDGIMALSGRLNEQTGYYENDHVKNFGFYFSKTDEVIEEEIKGVLVRILYPPNGKDVAKLAMETAKEAIPFYIELMGSYPYAFLNIIPGGPGVWGGYPFASGIVIIHGMQFFDQGSERHWRWITAHEIGHEYWGEYVLDGDEVPFLWIALGIYADWKFSRHIGLSDVKHRNWANYYLSGLKKDYNTTMDIRPEEEASIDFDRNNYVIHAKGFSFISALEMAMGKDLFQQAYVKTLEKFGGKRLTNRDFQEICEETSGKNLEWFFDAWLRSNQYVSAFINSTSSVLEGEKYKSTVTVYHESEFYMPVPVYASFEDGSVQIKMTDRVNQSSTISFISDSRLSGAVIDPAGCLANLDEHLSLPAENVIQKIRALPYSGAGEKAYTIYRQAWYSDKEEIADEWYQLGMALYDAGYSRQAKSCFYYGLDYGSGDKAFIINVWLGHISDLQGDRKAAIDFYNKALKAWDGSPFIHSQYNMTVDKSWVEQRLKEPFELEEMLSW